jgi:hypothetical protein
VYTDLFTFFGGGPQVTVTVPASGRVLVTVTAHVQPTRAVATAYMSFASTGGSGNVSASDDKALYVSHGDPSTLRFNVRASATYLVTGLSPGAHTFTAKYRTSDPNISAGFVSPVILVVALP